MSKSGEIKGLDKLVKDLINLGDEGKEVVHEVTKETTKDIVKDAKLRAPRHNGKLYQNIVDLKVDDYTYKVMVNNTVPYAAFIEFGTGGKVNVPNEMKAVASQFKGRKGGSFADMIESLIDWVRLKGITGSYSVKTRKRSRAKNSRGESNADEDRRVAFVIAMAILKNGIEPQPFLYPAFVKGRLEYYDTLKKELKALVKKSMNLPLPDKEIRKAIFALVNDMVVDGNEIKCFDSRVTTRVIPNYYVLMTTQTNQVNEGVKCGDRYNSSILLDIVTRYNATLNTGSRLLADNIADAVRTLLVNKLTLGQGLNVVNQTLDFPNDLSSTTENENIFRKFIRVELVIN